MDEHTKASEVILFAMIAVIAKKAGMSPQELVAGVGEEMKEQKYISEMLIEVIRMSTQKRQDH